MRINNNNEPKNYSFKAKLTGKVKFFQGIPFKKLNYYASKIGNKNDEINLGKPEWFQRIENINGIDTQKNGYNFPISITINGQTRNFDLIESQTQISEKPLKSPLHKLLHFMERLSSGKIPLSLQ